MAVVALVVGVAIPKGSHSVIQPLSGRQILAMETAALRHLSFPQAFVRLDRGCSSRRCYLVASPSTSVAGTVPRLLRSSGIKPPGALRAAEPVSMLRAAHWSTDSSDPLVIACKTTSSSTHSPLIECQDAGRIGQTLINVLIRPYEPCGNQTCLEPGKTEVLAWSVALPNNA
jgi:hypothetical protein